MRKQRLLPLIGAALIGVGFYASRVEPRWVRVRYVPVRLHDLPPAFHDFRIAHISDIHLGAGAMNRAHLAEVVDLLNTLRPDLVAITGDFVERVAGDVADDLRAALGALQPPAVAVLGNHDYSLGVNAVRRVLRDCGIIELTNAVHTIRRGDAALYIAGVDSVSEGQDCLDAVLDQLPDDGIAVLLAHEPDFADISAATGRFDVQLSGHTHGGQLRLPLIGAPVLPAYGQRYPDGRYQVGKMTQYTSRGLGTIRPHLRLNARPEIAIIMLEVPHA